MENNSFIEKAKAAFDKNKDLSGLQGIIDGVNFYMDKLAEIVNDAEEADIGLAVYAMSAFCEALRNGIPGAAETEKLVAAMVSATVITVPLNLTDEREGEK